MLRGQVLTGNVYQLLEGSLQCSPSFCNKFGGVSGNAELSGGMEEDACGLSEDSSFCAGHLRVGEISISRYSGVN